MMLQNSLNIISDIEQNQHLKILVSDMSMLNLFDSTSNLYKIGIYCQSNSEMNVVKSYRKNSIPFLYFSNLKNTSFDVIIAHNNEFVKNALKFTDAKYIYCSTSNLLSNNYKLISIGYNSNWFIKKSTNNTTKKDDTSSIIKLTKIDNITNPLVFIVIPVYNQADFTVKCLNSISKYAEEKYKITCVVVDNGSNDENKNKVNQCIDNIKNISVKLLEFDKPIGYVRATNARY